ncbi:MAG: hypothetical protein LBL04_16860 [Bacteroidales bacterium]|jgi:hypothetical protein|nr:hypothetical protein [Bacteroidales bacterium]
MKKCLLYVLAVLMMVSSCAKSDLDFPVDDGINKDPGPGSTATNDTIGVHPFLGSKYIMLTPKEQRLLYYAKEKGLYSFRAIALPEGDHPSRSVYPQEIQDVMFDFSNNNTFLGYPVSVEVGGNPFIVVERRVSENNVNEYSDGAFLTVNSNSKWELTDFFKYAPFGRFFMGTQPLIGKTDAGILAIKANIGVLLSDNNGQHWSHHPKAFDALDENDYAFMGANMAYHHKFGSLFFGTGSRKMKNDTVQAAILEIDPGTGNVSERKTGWMANIERSLVINERDTVIQMPIAETGPPVFYVVNPGKTPDLAAYDGYIVALSVFKEKIYQFVYACQNGDSWDDAKFISAQTTITGSLSRQSPPGIIYNPVTRRFEMIQSNPYELSLYSISVEDLLNSRLNEYGRAQWTKEVSLLQRNTSVRGQGMYPVSSMVDTQKGVQRVFISFGDEYPGRSGIFELTRTLKTSELSDFVKQKRSFIESQPF